MKAKVSGGERVKVRMPERASRNVPSPLPLEGNGGGRVIGPLPARASVCMPSALPSNSGGRGKANRRLPAKASSIVPSPGRRSSKSGKRGKAIESVPAKAKLTQPSSASPDLKARRGGQPVGASNGHGVHASPPALSPTIDRVFLLYEQRRDLLSTASGMTSRLKALTKIRRGLPVSAKVSEAMIIETDYPPIDTLLSARSVLRDHLGKIEKQLERFAQDLPAYASYWKPQRGLSGLGLALIAGEAGDLGGYSTHSKLWRRFGLHVDGGGRAYWKRRPGLSDEDWETAGYCPRRRSIIFQLTDSLLKAQIRKDENDPEKRVALGEYGALYLREKARQQEKAKAEGLTVCPAAKIPAKSASKYRSDGHIHNRAARYVGKKLLRDLWKVWRREATDDLPIGHSTHASRSPSKSAGRVTVQLPARASASVPSPPSSPAT